MSPAEWDMILTGMVVLVGAGAVLLMVHAIRRGERD